MEILLCSSLVENDVYFLFWCLIISRYFIPIYFVHIPVMPCCWMFIYFWQFIFLMYICEFLFTLIYVIDMLYTSRMFFLTSLPFFLLFHLSVFYLCIYDLSTFIYVLSSRLIFLLWIDSYYGWCESFTMIVYIHC